MKKYWKKKWIAALRSGEYKQARGKLRAEKKSGKFSYCCLGVLCDIASDVKFDRDGSASYQGYHSASDLPTSALDKFGVDYQTEGVLIAMNDDNGKSFKQIAEYIEKNL